MGKSLTDLGYVNEAMDQLHQKIEQKLQEQNLSLPTRNTDTVFILFLSIGNPDIRARVHHVVEKDLHKAIKNVREKALQLVRKNHLKPQWIKLDLVTEIEAISFQQLEKQIAKTRRNYFRSGIAFDDEFRLAFLEQEINGNAMIRSVNKGPLQLNEKNINHYLKHHSSVISPFMKQRYINKQVYTFQTEALFMNRNEEEILELYNGVLTNGIRKIKDSKMDIKSLIEGATYFLTNQVKADGQFEYGYFSAFAKRIGTYNILRHSSSLYAMAEGYELIKDETIIETVEKGIDYVIREAMVYKEDQDIAFIVDVANHNEIKLGSNATAILAMTKYMEQSNSTKYLKEARALARGIIAMKTVSG